MTTNGICKRQNRNYTLKVSYARKVERYETHSISRFTRKSKRINWRNKPLAVYVRVSENGLWNDGTYDNKRDFDKAIKVFLNEG